MLNKIKKIIRTLKCKKILIICNKMSLHMFIDYFKDKYKNDIDNIRVFKDKAYIKLKNGYYIELSTHFNEYRRDTKNPSVYIEYNSISIDYDKMYLIKYSTFGFCKKDAVRFIFAPEDINEKEIKSNMYNFIHCIDKNIFKI